MSPRCNCGARCNCLIEAGEGVTVSGVGTSAQPYVIAADDDAEIAAAIDAHEIDPVAHSGTYQLLGTVAQVSPTGDSGAAVQAAITALAGPGTIQLLPGTHAWSTTPALPAALTNKLTVMGLPGAKVILSAAAPRLLDFNRTGNDLVFRNIEVSDLLIDANNIDGPALGPATTCTSTVSLVGSGTVTNASVASTAGWRPSGAVYLAALGRSMAYTSIVNATTIAIRNDGATATLNNGDAVVGQCVNHVVAGTSVTGGAVNQSRMNFDRLAFRRLQVINVPTDAVTLKTARPGISLTPTNAASDPATDITNILVEDYDQTGGSTGIVIGIQGAGAAPCLGFIDNIVVKKVRHTTSLVPTAFYSSAHVQLGGSSRGGACWVEDVWGEYSGDVGIEIDGFVQANVSDCYVEDAYGSAYLATSFNSPGRTAQPTTTLSAGITDSVGNIPVVDASVLAPSGIVYIGTEAIVYGSVSGNTLQNTVRGAFGSTNVAHLSADVVTQFSHTAQVTWARCHAQRTRVTPTATFLCQGFYAARVGFLPPPHVRLRDCTYTRNKADLITRGEALHVGGGCPSADVDGFKIIVEGVNYPTLDSVQADAIYFVQSGPLTLARTAPVPVALKNIHVRTTGIIGAGNSGSSGHYSAVTFNKGFWHIDVQNVNWFHHLNEIGPSHTCMFNFSSDPTGYFTGSIRNARLRNYSGDFAPLALRVPSTSFGVVRSLTIEDLDLFELAYSSYIPISINATNLQAIRLSGTTHPTGVADQYDELYDDYTGIPGDLYASGEETTHRMLTGGAQLGLSTQVLRVGFWTARKTETVTSIRVPAVIAAAATPTLIRFGIYDIDASDNGTLIASTPNDTTLLASTTTPSTKAFSVPWAKVRGRRYAVGMLCVTAATAPSVIGSPNSTNYEMSQVPRLGGSLAGQADLPATFTSAALGTGSTSQRPYAVMVP